MLYAAVAVFPGSLPVRLDRKLQASGFHANLSTTVALSAPAEEACCAVVCEAVSPSVIVDPWEVARLSAHTGVRLAAPRGSGGALRHRQYLELTAAAAGEVLAEGLTLCAVAALARGSDSVRVDLPVHARYQPHRVGGGGSAVCVAPPTAAFALCPPPSALAPHGGALGGAAEDVLERMLRRAPALADPGPRELCWEVPVGDTSLGGTARWWTDAVVWAAAAAVAAACLCRGTRLW
eukprot:TRINITY_DN35289_c0_g1_i1.p1 TRINITY_DN35289_c0_g1~~TRINITY_DN35289_c0_g1_i1.p1  ORF type:complete len:264 (+),score=46.52 TRINITY_DN35289_c0_g1_i1:85-792(+)